MCGLAGLQRLDRDHATAEVEDDALVVFSEERGGDPRAALKGYGDHLRGLFMNRDEKHDERGDNVTEHGRAIGRKPETTRDFSPDVVHSIRRS